MKTNGSRIDEAVKYIFNIGKSELANHVKTLAARNVHNIDISLGSRPDWSSSPQYGNNTRKREALRALLLCQRVYFSDLWAETIVVGGARMAYNYLQLIPAWKNQSIGYWSNRSEAQIQEAILTFSLATANTAALVTAAGAMPGRGAQPDITLTRATIPFPGLVSCYGSVMTWLFQSGLVSYRWYMKNSNASNKATLEQAFGANHRILWPAAQPFTANDALPPVPAGHIVHLFVDNPTRWNGHWLVSLGGGRAAACNNDTTDGTANNYTPGCSLDAQFLNGYKHPLPSGALEQGLAVAINPLEIPNRI